MLLRFDATLNGRNFSDLSPNIILRDIVELPAEVDLTRSRWATRPGQRVISKVRTALSVRLVYVIREYDIDKRAEARDKVAQWAKDGGYLTINTRPGKRLYVVSDNPPSLDSSLRWTQDLVITLTAYELPFWQSEKETKKSFTVSRDGQTNEYTYSGTMTVEGNTNDIRAGARIINIDTLPLTWAKIVCGGSCIELESLNIPTGDRIDIRYDEHQMLHIDSVSSDGTEMSIMRYRTAESNDDLKLIPGIDNKVEVHTNSTVICEIGARGMWI